MGTPIMQSMEGHPDLRFIISYKPITIILLEYFKSARTYLLTAKRAKIRC